MSLIDSFAADPEQYIPYFVIGLSMLVGIVAIAGGLLVGLLQSRDRERTRREVAAYLAEGSITDDQADRLLADKRKPRCFN